MESKNLEEYLSKRFPEWTQINVRNLTDITSGWETKIFSFDIRFTESGDEKEYNWIARAFPGAPGIRRAQSEFRTYQILQALDYPIPNVFFFETDTSYLGKPFIIMERIHGHTVQDLINSGSEQDRLNLIKEVSKLFVKLHKTDWSKSSEIPHEYYQVTPREMFLQRLDGIRNWLTDDGAEYLLPLVDWLQDNIDTVSFDRFSLLHNDFHPMNILIDADRNYYVIDWTAARLGDYRSDLAWTMMLAFIYNANDYWQILLKEYEISAGEKVENIDFFIIEASIRRFADVLISLSEGAESLGMLEDTEEQMRASISSLTRLHGLVEKITGLRISRVDELIEKFA